MPFVQRRVSPVLVSRAALPAGVDDEREAVVNNTLAGTLRQMASVMLHAGDICDQLLEEFNRLSSRSKRLLTRVSRLQEAALLLDAKSVLVPESDLSSFSRRGDSTVVQYVQDTALFTVESRPALVSRLYEQAVLNPVTVLRQLDVFRRDGQRSSRFFTCTPTLDSQLARLPLEIETRLPVEVDALPDWSPDADLTSPVHPDSRFNPHRCGSDEQTSASCRLPRPEQLTEARSKQFPAQLVPVDTTGSGFQRLIKFRQSLIHFDYVKHRRKRRARQRRNTISDTTDVLTSLQSTSHTSDSVDVSSADHRFADSALPQLVCSSPSEQAVGGELQRAATCSTFDTAVCPAGGSDSGQGSTSISSEQDQVSGTAAHVQHTSDIQQDPPVGAAVKPVAAAVVSDACSLYSDYTISAELGGASDDDASSAFSCDAEGYYTSFHCDSGVRGAARAAAVDADALTSTSNTSGSGSTVVLRRRGRPAPPPRRSSLNAADRLSVLTVIHVPTADNPDTADDTDTIHPVSPGLRDKTAMTSGRIPSLCAVSVSEEDSLDSEDSCRLQQLAASRDGGATVHVQPPPPPSPPPPPPAGECSDQDMDTTSDSEDNNRDVTQPASVRLLNQMNMFNIVQKNVRDREYLRWADVPIPEQYKIKHLANEIYGTGEEIAIRRADHTYRVCGNVNERVEYVSVLELPSPLPYRSPFARRLSSSRCAGTLDRCRRLGARIRLNPEGHVIYTSSLTSPTPPLSSSITSFEPGERVNRYRGQSMYVRAVVTPRRVVRSCTLHSNVNKAQPTKDRPMQPLPINNADSPAQSRDDRPMQPLPQTDEASDHLSNGERPMQPLPMDTDVSMGSVSSDSSVDALHPAAGPRDCSNQHEPLYASCHQQTSPFTRAVMSIQDANPIDSVMICSLGDSWTTSVGVGDESFSQVYRSWLSLPEVSCIVGSGSARPCRGWSLQSRLDLCGSSEHGTERMCPWYLSKKAVAAAEQILMCGAALSLTDFHSDAGESLLADDMRFMFGETTVGSSAGFCADSMSLTSPLDGTVFERKGSSGVAMGCEASSFSSNLSHTTSNHLPVVSTSNTMFNSLGRARRSSIRSLSSSAFTNHFATMRRSIRSAFNRASSVSMGVVDKKHYQPATNEHDKSEHTLSSDTPAFVGPDITEVISSNTIRSCKNTDDGGTYHKEQPASLGGAAHDYVTAPSENSLLSGAIEAVGVHLVSPVVEQPGNMGRVKPTPVETSPSVVSGLSATGSEPNTSVATRTSTVVCTVHSEDSPAEEPSTESVDADFVARQMPGPGVEGVRINVEGVDSKVPVSDEVVLDVNRLGPRVELGVDGLNGAGPVVAAASADVLEQMAGIPVVRPSGIDSGAAGPPRGAYVNLQHHAATDWQPEAGCSELLNRSHDSSSSSSTVRRNNSYRLSVDSQLHEEKENTCTIAITPGGARSLRPQMYRRQPASKLSIHPRIFKQTDNDAQVDLPKALLLKTSHINGGAEPW